LTPDARDEKHCKMSVHDLSYAGESVEKEVFKKLKNYFAKSNLQNVTIFSGWEDKGIFKKGQSREFDFIIVSSDAKKVIHLEVKRTNNDKNKQLNDAISQLHKGYNFLSEKVPFSNGWKFVSAVFLEYDDCKTANDFILIPDSSFGDFFGKHLNPSNDSRDCESYKVIYTFAAAEL